MKRPLLLALCLVLASAAPLSGQDNPASLPADLSEIARGYANAYKHMVSNHVVVYYKIDGKTYVLNNIVAVDSYDAIVFFKFTGEDHLAINAGQILFMTDSGQIAKPAADDALKPSN